MGPFVFNGETFRRTGEPLGPHMTQQSSESFGHTPLDCLFHEGIFLLIWPQKLDMLQSILNIGSFSFDWRKIS